jgi:hypothetical protein
MRNRLSPADSWVFNPASPRLKAGGVCVLKSGCCFRRIMNSRIGSAMLDLTIFMHSRLVIPGHLPMHLYPLQLQKAEAYREFHP